MNILIKNVFIVNEGMIQTQDIYIKKGRIETIADQINPSEVDIEINAENKYLLPGMIDDQVHFREPGITYKADLATESLAAVRGGVTSIMDMPNTKPSTLTIEALEAKYQLAQEKCVTNYSFYLGASNDNLEEIKKLKPNQTCGVKIFMGASTGNMLVDNPVTLEALFQEAPTLIATHCEDTPTILANEALYREKYGEEVPMACHPYIRSEEACYKSSALAVALAKKFNTQLHVLHITTEKELALFTDLPLEQKHITAEVCVHHLYFSEEDYQEKGSFIKCNPAIKKLSDKKALVQAVKDNKLDVIGSDHAPHTLEEKNNPYFKAPAGLAYIQHSMPALLEYYHEGIWDLPLIVEKTAHAVAKRFQIQARGFIREGYFADLTLVDLNQSETVKREDSLHKCGWSAFEGRHFRSSVVMTMVSGNLVYYYNRLKLSHYGQRLAFNR